MSQTATKHALGEVRLKVAYKKPEALLSEYTRSVGQGGVTLQVKKSLPVGTRFVFEMHNPGVATPVEVLGEVVRVTPTANDRYMITVKYDAGMDRGGLDAVLQRIFDLQAFEKLRRYPRIPLRLPAMEEETPFAPPYFVKDLSRGGVGLEVEAPALPASVKVGMPFMLEPPVGPRCCPPSASTSARSPRTRWSDSRSCSPSSRCPPRPGAPASASAWMR
jgi:hypothetical protein